MEKEALVPKRITLHGKIKPFIPESVERIKIQVQINRISLAGEPSPGLIEMLRTMVSQRSGLSGHYINLTTVENDLPGKAATIFNLVLTTDPHNSIVETNVTEAIKQLSTGQIINLFAAGNGVDPSQIEVTVL